MERKSSPVARAFALALEAHAGQTDRAGMPYIGHVMRVMTAGRTEAEKVVGALHDVVEDTGLTFDDLAAAGFGPEVIDALRLLTHEPDEPYDEYIERLAGNPLAVAVKINDLTDNMDLRRLTELTDRDVVRLRKYLRAYRRLTVSEP